MQMSTYQGYATQFDYDSKQWMHLSEESCFIELVAPLKILLYNGKRVHFLNIQLQPSFQFQKQNPTSVILYTSHDGTAQTYGFSLTDEVAANAYEQGLARLREYKEPQQPYIGYAAENYSRNQFNTSDDMLNPFQGAQPRKTQYDARNPFQTAQPRKTQYDARNPFQTAQPRATQYDIRNQFQTAQPRTTQNQMRNQFQTAQPGHFTAPQPRIPNTYHNSYEPMRHMNPVRSAPLLKPKPIMFQNYVGNFNAQEYYERNEENSDMKLNNFINEHGVNEHKPLCEEENLCQLLSEAIEGGNVDLAQEFVGKLAEKMTKITISQQTPKRSEFNILIQIDDKNESEGAIITESVDPHTTTIHMLKYQIFRKYEFPVNAQIWIIGKSIAKDNDTLSKCGIKTTGTMVYLYLKSSDDPYVKLMKSKHETSQTDENITNFMNELYNKSISHQDVAQQFGYIFVQPKPNEMNLFAVPPEPVREIEGWNCVVCTLRNLPTFEGCIACTEPRPNDYKIPPNYKMTREEIERLENATRNEHLAIQLEYQRKADEALAAQENYTHHLQMMDQRLLPNQEDFVCSICYDDVKRGEGVILRECLHNFCRECLIATINNSEDPEVHCPHNDDFPCGDVITMQEIEELLEKEDYDNYLRRSVQAAERGAKDSFHCQYENCVGWCFYEDDVNNFLCQICNHNNCLTCKAIHTDQTCQEYQDDLKIRADNDEAAKQTQKMLEDLINTGEAMNCPHCKVILQKKSGCDWMKCSMCRTEICWATKGPRWGPKGNGDTSGGCKCGVNGRCTPNCGNCH